MPKPDSLQGSLDLLVLKILSRRPGLHGYAIMTAIQDPAALAGALLAVLVITATASIAPVARAVRIEPVAVLKVE